MKKIKINSESEMLIFYSFQFFIVNMLYANFDYSAFIYSFNIAFATNYCKYLFVYLFFSYHSASQIVGNSEAKFIVEFLLAVGGKISLYYFF